MPRKNNLTHVRLNDAAAAIDASTKSARILQLADEQYRSAHKQLVQAIQGGVDGYKVFLTIKFFQEGFSTPWEKEKEHGELQGFDAYAERTYYDYIEQLEDKESEARRVLGDALTKSEEAKALADHYRAKIQEILSQAQSEEDDRTITIDEIISEYHYLSRLPHAQFRMDGCTDIYHPHTERFYTNIEDIDTIPECTYARIICKQGIWLLEEAYRESAQGKVGYKRDLKLTPTAIKSIIEQLESGD